MHLIDRLIQFIHRFFGFVQTPNITTSDIVVDYTTIGQDMINLILSFTCDVDKYLVSKKLYLECFGRHCRKRETFIAADGKGLYPKTLIESPSKIVLLSQRCDELHTRLFGRDYDVFMKYVSTARYFVVDEYPPSITKTDARLILKKGIINDTKILAELIDMAGNDDNNYRDNDLLYKMLDEYPQLAHRLGTANDGIVSSFDVTISRSYDFGRIYPDDIKFVESYADIATAVENISTFNGLRNALYLTLMKLSDDRRSS